MALRQAEDLGDVQDVARPVAADADLGVAGLEDLVAMDLGVHEARVDVVDRGTGAHVVAEDLPVLDLGADVGVVVDVTGGRHVAGVLAGQSGHVAGDCERSQAPARALAIDVGDELGFGLIDCRPGVRPRCRGANAYENHQTGQENCTDPSNPPHEASSSP